MSAHMDRFLSVYEEVQAFLLADMTRRFDMDANRVRYVKDMMNATCIGGKYNRGLCVVEVAEKMAEDGKMGADEKERVLHDACVCGWMVEFLQAHFLVEDDIMDKSTVRRGRPCWYLHPGVTMQVAINDGLILFAWATRIATHFLAAHPCMPEVLRVFHEVHMATTIGQLYDVTSMVDSSKLDANVAHPTTTDYVEYTLFNYKRIVRCKTAYYTYWLPLVMGLLVSESMDKVDQSKLEDVSMLMGEYFQVQDDVMDCFTPPEKLGKVGTDIQDAKCSWLAVTFLATAPDDQVALFKESYGRPDEAKVELIRKLFTDAKLQDKFAAYEEDIAKRVTRFIGEIETQSPAFAASIRILWEKTHRRQK